MSNLVASRSWLANYQYAHNVAGAGAPVIVWATVGAAPLEKGVPVTIAAGDLTVADAASAAIYGITAAAGDIGEVIPVYAAVPDNLFIGKANAESGTTDYPFDGSILHDGTEFRVEIDGAVGAEQFRVIGVVPTDDAGDDTVFGRVYFRVMESQF